MAIKSIMDLNKDLRTTLNNVPALIDTLERGFTGVNNEISSGVEAKKAVDSFETINGGLLSECKVKLTPVQSGTGDPSPTNVRPISGHTQAEVNVSDGQSTQKQITVNLGGTYYGGTLDVISGELTVTHIRIDLGDKSWDKSGVRHYTTFTAFDTSRPYAPENDDSYIAPLDDAMCSNYVATSRQNVERVDYGLSIHATGTVYITIRDTRYDDLSGADFKTAISGVYLCYKLAVPQTIQLAPTMVKVLTGVNNISAPLDGQEIVEVEYKEIFTFEDVEKAIDNAVASVYPASPATDGSYVLTLVKDGTSITRSWVSTES